METFKEHFGISELMLRNNLQLYNINGKSSILKYIEECKIVRGDISFSENTGIINIANRYYIRPQMSLEEIMNSNIFNILVYNYETEKSCFMITKLKHLYLKTIFTGEHYLAIIIELENNKLSKIHINTVNPKYPYQNEDLLNRVHHCDDIWCNNDMKSFSSKFLKDFAKRNDLVFRDNNNKISFNKGCIDYIVSSNIYNFKKYYSLKISYSNI